MTTAPTRLPERLNPTDTVALPDLPQPSAGSRASRRRARRRLAREQMIVVLVLILALAATVLILGQQWLHSGAATANGDAIATLVSLSGGGR